MDRFIEEEIAAFPTATTDLKSNMDRFIGEVVLLDIIIYYYLKSNMDRFIETLPLFLHRPRCI